ncbi:unnamed protein product, partial [Closterium sp. Naga37s-1]
HLLQFDSEALEKHLQAVPLPSLLLLSPHDQAIFFPDEVTRPLSYAGVLVMSLLLLSPHDRATFFLEEAQQQSQPRQDISSSLSHWWLDPGCYATDESDWVAVEAIHSGAEEFRAVGDDEEGESREGGRDLGRQQGEENELQQQQKQQLQKSFLPLTPQPAAASGLAPSTQEGTAKQQLKQSGKQPGRKNDAHEHGLAGVDDLDELLGGQAGSSSGATRAENLQTKQKATGAAAPVNVHGHGNVHGFAGEDDLDELLVGQAESSRGASATKEEVKVAGGLGVATVGAAQVTPAAVPQTLLEIQRHSQQVFLQQVPTLPPLPPLPPPPLLEAPAAAAAAVPHSPPLMFPPLVCPPLVSPALVPPALVPARAAAAASAASTAAAAAATGVGAAVQACGGHVAAALHSQERLDAALGRLAAGSQERLDAALGRLAAGGCADGCVWVWMGAWICAPPAPPASPPSSALLSSPSPPASPAPPSSPAPPVSHSALHACPTSELDGIQEGLPMPVMPPCTTRIRLPMPVMPPCTTRIDIPPSASPPSLASPAPTLPCPIPIRAGRHTVEAAHAGHAAMHHSHCHCSSPPFPPPVYMS